MFKINKTTPPASFTNFLKRKPQNWSETKNISHEWREYILRKEQFFMSGYTEKPLTVENSHIDHFKRKAIAGFEQYTFDWNNFIVDEIDNTNYGAGHKDNCINSPSNYSDIINPTEEDPRHYFKYSLDGTIIARENLDKQEFGKAQNTISVFNLNHPSLKNLRKEIIRAVESYENCLSKKDIRDALCLSGFATVVEQFTDCK